MKKIIPVLLLATLFLTSCGSSNTAAPVSDDVITLRVANSEEYIDEGGWDADETIKLENGEKIRGVNSLVDDFADWYQEKYGKRVRVLYSTYGTNEDLYNQMTLGNTFDLVCPSEYMIMKLMREKRLEPLSDDFYDTSQIYNYYAKGVSPYIYQRMKALTEGGEELTDYAAGYMWGTLGTVYNPSVVSEEDASTFAIYLNQKYRKRITIKDSIRDTYFAGLAIDKEKDLSAWDGSPDALSDILNDTSQQTVDKVQDIITDMRENAYSMETDTAKQDLVTRKADASLQWSGDAVYSMDQADEQDISLCYAVPDEGSNLWFDGWVMMKNGIDGNKDKKQAAEAFINFISRPDSVIRNMYYIGYTSAITGGDSDEIADYLRYTYGSDEDDALDYDVSYLFDRPTVIKTSPDQLKRQLYAQYPTEDVLSRCAVMKCFSEPANRRISQMWTNVRCYRFPWER